MTSLLECPVCRILLRRVLLTFQLTLPVDFYVTVNFQWFYSFVFVLSFASSSRRGHQVVEETFSTCMFLALLIFSGRNRHLGWWRLFYWLWEYDKWLHWDWDGGLEDGLVEGSHDGSNLFNKSLRNGVDNFHFFWLWVLVFSNVLGYILGILVRSSCFSCRRTCWPWPCAPEPQPSQTLISAGRDSGGFWNLDFSVILHIV